MAKPRPIALITGASSGIGRELARLHARKGGDLVIIARRKDRLDELKAELESAHGAAVTVVPADLNDPAAPRAIHEAVKAAGIEIDYLVNNAGFGGLGLFHEADWEQHERMIAVNITALTALTRLFLPDMVARGKGRILNVSSTASLLPGPWQAVYFASKAYVTSLSNAIDQEVRKSGVTVTALLPGATASEFRDVAGLDGTSLFRKSFTSEQVAKTGYNGMLRGKLNVLAGVTLGQRIMFHLMPFLPLRTKLRQVEAMQSRRTPG